MTGYVETIDALEAAIIKVAHQLTPRFGDRLKEMTSGRFNGETYDRGWDARAKETLW
ncbi:hypothetical protein [Profundibacter sp.]